MSTAISTDVSFNHRGESYTLWLRGGKFYLRLTRNGKPIWKSLKTTQKAAAIERAKKDLDALEKNDWKPEAKVVAPRRFATLGEILDCFRKSGSQTLISPRAIRQYAGSFKDVVSKGIGKEYQDTMSSTLLTEELIRKYMAACRHIDSNTGKPFRPDHSIQSSITQARCVLQENFSDIYRDLMLPDLTGFRAKKRFKKRVNEGFVPFDRQTVIDMEAAAERLWENRDAVWICYALMSQLGLRNGEVAKATWDQFIERPIFDVKGIPTIQRFFRVRADYAEAVGRELPVSDSLWEKLKAFKDEAVTEFVCPGKNKSERSITCLRQINRFAERFIRDREKISYELRKWAGSIVATRYGIYEAQKFLGHRSVTTTETYYASYLKSLSSADSAARNQIYGLTSLQA
jgi:integrase